jgi:ligand-binding sensor domain-containing protein
MDYPQTLRMDIFQASTGEVWLGNMLGATIVDRKKGTLQFLENGQQLFAGEDNTACAGLSEDAEGKIWMGNSVRAMSIPLTLSVIISSGSR